MADALAASKPVQNRKTAIAISVLIIALGLAWLLNELHVIPGIDWFWVTGLGVSGLLLLTVAGLDRFNFIVGVSLMVCSVLSVLRQKKVLTADLEPPILFTTVGLLLLLAHLLKLPVGKSTPVPAPGEAAAGSTTPGGELPK